MDKGNDRDIKWWELGLAAGFCLGTVLSLQRFSTLNPGWGSLGNWPSAVWAAGLSAAAFALAFLAVIYRCYLRRRYGSRAPIMLAGFVALHAVAALLMVGRGLH